MKYLLFGFCFLISMNADAQRKKRPKPEYFLKVQGGYLFDAHSKADYAGFNIVNLGWTKFINDRLDEINLEFISYTSDFQREEGPNTTAPKWRRKRKSVELDYFRALFSKGNIRNGFFLGPAASVMYIKNNFDPSSSSRVKYEEKCYCFGLGVKAVYTYGLSRKVYLNLSTKSTLLDLGFNSKQEFSPWLPLSRQKTSDFKTDLLRNQFAMMLGLQFRL